MISSVLCAWNGGRNHLAEVLGHYRVQQCLLPQFEFSKASTNWQVLDAPLNAYTQPMITKENTLWISV